MYGLFPVFQYGCSDNVCEYRYMYADLYSALYSKHLALKALQTTPYVSSAFVSIH